jgi:hypothetical protein
MKMNGTLTPSAFAMQSVCRSLFVDLKRELPFEYLDNDLLYLFQRFNAEGDPFLLISLPKLGKEIERALIREEQFNAPPGWRLKKGTRLPLFLNHLFLKVFLEDGSCRLDGDPRAVLYLRQITMIFSKVCGCVDQVVVQKAIEEFRLRTTRHVDIFSMPEVVLAREILRHLFDLRTPECDELRRFQKKPWGRHGNGAVADFSNQWMKWQLFAWPGMPKEAFSIHQGLDLESGVLPTQPNARVVAVPKDFRGPRIICIEPKENQFVQQGLMDILYRLLHNHPLTRRSIDFRDVTPSGRLCYNSDVATIDLKDASDMLSISLARCLLPSWVFSLVARYRTRTVRFGNLTWHPNCFATMGNACCFPIETLVFWVLTQATCVLERKRGIISAVKNIRVFGDDIILPRKAAPRVIEVLEGCGLRVNRDKTCLKTLVKESCGTWCYRNTNLEIIKVKSTNVTDARSWVQYLDYSIQAAKLGLPNLAETMRELCQKWLPVIPIRFNRKLQRKEFRRPMFASIGRSQELPGEAGLYAYFVRNDTAPRFHGTVKVKRKWVSEDPYGPF